MSYALLFSGQGHQHGEMLAWLDAEPAAGPVLGATSQTLGRDWRAALDGADGGTRNRVAQVTITGTALAMWSCLRARLPADPVVLAGYSVGELAACAAAGVLEADQALQLAAERARLMDEAAAGTETGLVHVAGIAEAELLARFPDLECAIRIDADHAIYGGTRAAIDRAAAALAGRADVKPVCVPLASHTTWMQRAATGFATFLESQALRAPRSPVAMNAIGSTTRDPLVIASALSAQIARTLQWGGCMVAVAERRPRCVLEIGSGQALARMWSARHADVPARSVDDFRSVVAAIAWIERFA